MLLSYTLFVLDAIAGYPLLCFLLALHKGCTLPIGCILNRHAESATGEPTAPLGPDLCECLVYVGTK